MKRLLAFIITISMLLIFFPVSAAENELIGKSKEEVIEIILNIARAIYDAAPRQEGKKERGINTEGKITYTVYPEITKDIRDTLINSKLVEIRKLLEKYSLEVLEAGLADFKKALERQASFLWMPLYEDPQYVELNYYEASLVECFSQVTYKQEQALKEEEQKNQLKDYEDNWTSGMPSVWASESIQEAIGRGYVPQHLQDSYQNPITREEFSELFVTAVMEAFNKKIYTYYDDIKAGWKFDKLTIDNFLSKMSTTEYFTDTDNKYIKVANILGMVNGVGSNKFNPDGSITREQVAVMIANYTQTRSYDSRYGGEYTADLYLSDIGAASSWAKEAVRRVFGSGYMKGTKPYAEDSNVSVKEKGYFDMKGLVTREQAIMIVMNLDEGILEHLILRGYVEIGMDELMSGFDIDGNTIKMRRSGYDSKRYVARKFMLNTKILKKTSYILDYKSEEFLAIFLGSYGTVNDMLEPYQMQKVVSGQQTYYDYKAFTVEHNKDGYLAVINKTGNYGYLSGPDSLGYYDKGEFVFVTLEGMNKSNSLPNALKSILSSSTLRDKEKNTVLGHIYPRQWQVMNKKGDYTYTDLKPVGTELGYAIETDASVYLNGKLVKSYSIGGKLAIKLDELKDFGYEYDVLDQQGEIRLYMPLAINKTYDDTKSKKAENTEGKDIYNLVGDKFRFFIWDRVKDESIEELACYKSKTGERFVLVDELWNDKFFHFDKNGYGKGQWATTSAYSVEGSPFIEEYIHNTNLALVYYKEAKHIEIKLLNMDEVYEYYKQEGCYYYLANQYPELAERIFSPEDYEAWLEAGKIVKRVIDPDMSESEKVKAIQIAIKDYGILEPGTIYSTWWDHNHHSASQALVERYSNAAGWYYACKMLLVQAGLEAFPGIELEVGEIDFVESNSGVIAVKIDGVWELVDFLPDKYLK